MAAAGKNDASLLSPDSSLFVPPTSKQQAEREWK